MFLPKKLKEARLNMGLSQEKLLVRLSNAGLSLSRNALFCWESGKTKPNVDELVKIAGVLEKPVTYFFNMKAYHSKMLRQA